MYISTLTFCLLFSSEVHNVYSVRRTIEEVGFQSEFGNVQLLMHASGPHNYLGILSRYNFPDLLCINCQPKYLKSAFISMKVCCQQQKAIEKN